MPFSPADFADDTDFERLVLDRLGTHLVRPAAPGAVHDVRGEQAGGRGSATVFVGTAEGGAARVEELLRLLRPIGFGAAYKVLDLLVEHVLRANGATSPKLSFETKSQLLANRPGILPAPLDQQPELWDRLAVLYVAFVEPRHAVTHRRASATTSGDLDVYDNARQRVDTVTADEIGSFNAAVHATAELVMAASNDTRWLGIVRWHLNALARRHQLPPLPDASDPSAHTRRLVMDLAPASADEVSMDLELARRTIAGQESGVWDLELHTDGRVFVGRWEDVPDPSASSFTFHAATPPDWLTELIPRAG